MLTVIGIAVVRLRMRRHAHARIDTGAWQHRQQRHQSDNDGRQAAGQLDEIIRMHIRRVCRF